MGTVRLTMAQALVRWLMAQRIRIDGRVEPLFPGVFAIFGHGNVTALSEALEAVKERFPTYRGQNEQGMGLAACGFAKAKRRRQILVCSSSIGPGATNMVTAAGVAHTNRLPVLFLAGDVFASRAPDPVLQQVEHFHEPAVTVNDAFRAVVRYWDRIQRPEQILQSLPQALGVMLDPGDCGPVFLGLCQDAQAEAFDYPERFFEETVHEVPRPRPDRAQLRRAAELLMGARRPLVVAGGGVRYSEAEQQLARFASSRGIPVAETVAGRGVLVHDHPANVGPLGILGSKSANELAARADLILAVGTRLQDFTTCSWTVFAPEARIVAINAARFDALKHRAQPVVGDAKVALEELDEALGDWRAPSEWLSEAQQRYRAWNAYVDRRTAFTNAELPSYAHVVGAVGRVADEEDLVLTAAGGLPGELCMNWRVRRPGTFDCEFGYSCMGYEISGALGAKLADPGREVFALLGDGSYLMMNSDIYTSVLMGLKLIVVVCDNGGFAVIDRLQRAKGIPSFNNQLEDCRIQRLERVAFAKHAEAMGAIGMRVHGIGELEQALREAKRASRTVVIHIDVHPRDWTEDNGAWWETGTPACSERESVRAAYQEHAKMKARQRIGV